MTSTPASPDLGDLYRRARTRICELVLDPANGDIDDVIVPATPEWTVHDVIAHLSGIAADGTSGNMEGAPGEAWTAAQVERNRGVAIADMIDGWAQTGPLMEAVLSSADGGLIGAGILDIHTHEADLRHAIGLPLDVPADMLEWAMTRIRDGFNEQVERVGLAAVAVDVSDVEWFRGRFGRRTADEVRAYPWRSLDGAPVDPEPYLDDFFVFGRARRSLGERAAAD